MSPYLRIAPRTRKKPVPKITTDARIANGENIDIGESDAAPAIQV